MTNEERFIVSCREVGEADVRDKLSAGRFSERKAIWASSWLEKLESAKSDATKDEERTSRLESSRNANLNFTYAIPAIFIVLLLIGITVFLKLR